MRTPLILAFGARDLHKLRSASAGKSYLDQYLAGLQGRHRNASENEWLAGFDEKGSFSFHKTRSSGLGEMAHDPSGNLISG
jgi:hypothetical protein